jgi:hypothetical protein
MQDCNQWRPSNVIGESYCVQVTVLIVRKSTLVDDIFKRSICQLPVNTPNTPLGGVNRDLDAPCLSLHQWPDGGLQSKYHRNI